MAQRFLYNGHIYQKLFPVLSMVYHVVSLTRFGYVISVLILIEQNCEEVQSHDTCSSIQ